MGLNTMPVEVLKSHFRCVFLMIDHYRLKCTEHICTSGLIISLQLKK